MTTCSRCGDCCDPVIVVFDPQEFAAQQLARLSPQAPDWEWYQYQFFLDHWRTESTFVSDTDGLPVHRVRCDQFDSETRSCMAHDRQPQACSGFPWYGRPVGDELRQPVAASLSPRCSFNADVPGRRMLPIVEVRTP